MRNDLKDLPTRLDTQRLAPGPEATDDVLTTETVSRGSLAVEIDQEELSGVFDLVESRVTDDATVLRIVTESYQEALRVAVGNYGQDAIEEVNGEYRPAQIILDEIKANTLKFAQNALPPETASIEPTSKMDVNHAIAGAQGAFEAKLDPKLGRHFQSARDIVLREEKNLNITPESLGRENAEYWGQDRDRDTIGNSLLGVFTRIAQTATRFFKDPERKEFSESLTGGNQKYPVPAVEMTVRQELTNAEVALGLRKEQSRSEANREANPAPVTPKDYAQDWYALAAYRLAAANIFSRISSAIDQVKANRNEGRASRQEVSAEARQVVEAPETKPVVVTKAEPEIKAPSAVFDRSNGALEKDIQECLKNINKDEPRALPASVAARLMDFDGFIDDALEAKVLAMEAISILRRAEGVDTITSPLSDVHYEKVQFLIAEAIRTGDFPDIGKVEIKIQDTGPYNPNRRIIGIMEELDILEVNLEVEDFYAFAGQEPTNSEKETKAA